ncbi:MAG: D-alanyl-D-alanine carboxypeptidase/D-alanyl-D-alanine-endopeptidase [Bacteroidales bacterium]|nr:D-alanyl-D-alanine carboxypeptidase/D-alanyl-D-alanine-endopeptidase [Bacteroidales bacterium]
MKRALYIFLLIAAIFTQSAKVQADAIDSCATYVCSIVDLETGEEIYNYDADRKVTPASLTKLFTTAAAISTLGTDATFETPVYYNKTSNSLIIIGRADATLGSQYFPEHSLNNFAAHLAKELKKRGITNVSEIVFCPGYIAERPMPSHHLRCDEANYYGAVPTDFTYADNILAVSLESPANIGAESKVLHTSPSINSKIRSYVTTYKKSSDSAYVYFANDGSLIIDGHIPSGKGEFTVKAANNTTPEQFASTFTTALKTNGINIAKSSVERVKEFQELIYTYKSPTIAEIATKTNRHSVNLFAEALLLHLAKDERTSWNKGAASLRDFCSKYGIENVKFTDGSGLSPMNEVTAREVTKLLVTMHHMPIADVYESTLAVSGAKGTLSSFGRGTWLENNFRGKTGSMESVFGVAGIFSYEGRKYAACQIVNHSKSSRNELREALKERLLQLMEQQNKFGKSSNNNNIKYSSMKPVIYQMFTRLFGNTNTTRKHNGTIEENGCGKLNDINDAALESLKNLGITHVWYTGVIRHASTTHYPFMTQHMNANVVKGKAGSPYAICDYYDVDPDLAVDVDKRLDEFKQLVERTHQHGMKVIIDFVPNHVARCYHSEIKPVQFGENDDTSVAFAPNNNFYYQVGQPFQSPVSNLDEPYVENPAKASGNDAFTTSPNINDWYETVKLNYGVDYRDGSHHFSPTPDTWLKMRDILRYWVSMGVDGFRVDMVEMVPVEFWRWVISQINMVHPNIIFIGEAYDMNKYRDYIAAGFNYLYDKVNFYDVVRGVVAGSRPASDIAYTWRQTLDINRQMLYFMENHDEQRIASEYFAGDAIKAKPAVMLATLLSRGATMLYFGQELGERGMDDEGFSGKDGRSTIFDYWGIESLQKWVGNHTYDESQLPQEIQDLRRWYAKLLNTVNREEALQYGEIFGLMMSTQHISVDASKIYAFIRYDGKHRFLVAVNFADHKQHINIRIPAEAWHEMGSTWNESIRPYDMLGNAGRLVPTSVNNTQNVGLELEIPANDGVLLMF